MNTSNITIEKCQLAKSSRKYKPSWLTRDQFEKLSPPEKSNVILSLIVRRRNSPSSGAVVDAMYARRLLALIELSFPNPLSFAEERKAIAIPKFVPSELTDAETKILTYFVSAVSWCKLGDYESAIRDFVEADELFCAYRCAAWIVRNGE